MGKIGTVLDLGSRLPRYVWFTEVGAAHDTNFLERLLKVSAKGTLWIFDRGFYDFNFLSGRDCAGRGLDHPQQVHSGLPRVAGVGVERRHPRSAGADRGLR